MEAKELLLEVGHQMVEKLSESESYDYLLQRISIAVQQGNAVAGLGTSHIPRNDLTF